MKQKKSLRKKEMKLPKHLEHINRYAAYIFALDNASAIKGGIYNIGDESLNFSKIDIAQAIGKLLDFEIIDSTLPDLDTRSFLVSFKKIKSLGYNTKLTLDDGIKELLKLYSFYKIYIPYNII